MSSRILNVCTVVAFVTMLGLQLVGAAFDLSSASGRGRPPLYAPVNVLSWISIAAFLLLMGARSGDRVE